MSDYLQDIDIKLLKKILPEDRDVQLGDDLLIADVNPDESFHFLKYPCRFNGFLAIFCIRGTLKIDINLKSYEVRKYSLIFNVPGNIVRVTEVDEDHLHDLRFMVVALSPEFMSNIRLDFKRLFNESMRIMNNPILSLHGEDLYLSAGYLRLASSILASSVPNKRDVLSPLISSFIFVLGTVWQKQLDVASLNGGESASSRLNLVYEKFLKLLTEYHNSERNVSFYAEKLCLTPKYLSKLIKQASGRSAPEWIDSFVILEAKNMLKYTDCPIKEIVFKLNFPNQSVFYKFFKSHTGFTPNEYRNS